MISSEKRSRTSFPVAVAAIFILSTMSWSDLVNANPDAKRLYDDLLMKNNYDVLIRPVSNHGNNLTVEINIKLSALVDVVSRVILQLILSGNLLITKTLIAEIQDEKNEIITTNLWLVQRWTDSSLVWNPREYGDVDMLYVPSESIWRPDIVLYNNADGDYVVTMMTKATIKYDGTVIWQPPAIYKSQCDIDVRYFPFDEQLCKMKFGDWTYDGTLVDMRHSENDGAEEDYVPEPAMDLTDYYKSVEWDLMRIRAKKTKTWYPCCPEPYPDVTFEITIRRKILYYTINLIVPCVSINLLTLLVFYLPADCGEKISICISIMLSLSLFQMLLMELVPGTSVVTPLIGKYLLFTCIIVSISVIASVIVLNFTQRSGATHRMSPLVQRIFLDILPKKLCMARPVEARRPDFDFSSAHSELLPFDNPYKKASSTRMKSESSLAAVMSEIGNRLGAGSAYNNGFVDSNGTVVCEACARMRLQRYPPNVHKALDSVQFIANHMASRDDDRRIKDDWKFLSKVVDRLLLYIYIAGCIGVGSVILLNCRVLYDNAKPYPFGK